MHFKFVLFLFFYYSLLALSTRVSLFKCQLSRCEKRKTDLLHDRGMIKGANELQILKTDEARFS